ncbi:unnamed protein product, partial [Musa banksii]
YKPWEPSLVLDMARGFFLFRFESKIGCHENAFTLMDGSSKPEEEAGGAGYLLRSSTGKCVWSG